ncbi:MULTISPECIES: SMI1/KNR4 family protein [Amycolatopsis]|uniref:SMI1/KNR4 family protein n=1 Tax=Amycolatopsis TaxID=1813 RepID=UPI000B8A9000|nr:MULTISPECIES: SMI1/KNR4 family protein [Amycolatopsis]OXM66245.1 SMI1/KNR4 family protein [Amycolatopsis sp. KNN50.9b]
MNTALTRLLERAKGPLGSPVEVELGGGVSRELAGLLSRLNGFALFDYGVQVFHAGPRGLGPELAAWNAVDTWKDTYGGLADGLLCFAQDLFGVQFAIEDDRRVVAFDPETGERTALGTGLDSWAGWLQEKPGTRGAAAFARLWQDTHGALGHDERLLPVTPFVLGGEYRLDNLVVRDAVTALRTRGPVAQQIHDLPDGTPVSFTVT